MTVRRIVSSFVVPIAIYGDCSVFFPDPSTLDGRNGRLCVNVIENLGRLAACNLEGEVDIRTPFIRTFSDCLVTYGKGKNLCPSDLWEPRTTSTRRLLLTLMIMHRLAPDASNPANASDGETSIAPCGRNTNINSVAARAVIELDA